MAKAAKSRGTLVTIILAVAIVVGIVLAIVFVNIFTPKSTKSLAESVNNVVTEGYLSDSYENNTTIDEYLVAVSDLESISEDDKNVIENFRDAMSAYQTMAEFFSRELIFSTYTDVYKSNASNIKSNLSAAQKQVDKMDAYLDESMPITGWVEAAVVLTWTDCQPMIETILEKTSSAIVSLMEVYSSCVDSSIMNNAFTDVIFMYCNTQIESILAGDSGVGSTLEHVVNLYLTTSGEEYIIAYSYNEELQTAAEDLLKNSVSASSGYYTDFVNGTLVTL